MKLVKPFMLMFLSNPVMSFKISVGIEKRVIIYIFFFLLVEMNVLVAVVSRLPVCYKV